ncbi:hypothetical protein [Brazilian marseillevirus]|uniref:hypothetical protein n=1 Tax=Brazilian marseillevirus TaxID=1813599 RepID=UPI0007844978|nr:hypothetical protein A3303_gp149 [Brazilian marseillevirus]AMQ10657.1 hypothetical protein [Brazilian marseillevirus]
MYKFLQNKEITSLLLATSDETTLKCCYLSYSKPYEASWVERNTCSSCLFVETGRTLWGKKYGDFVTKVYRFDQKTREKRLYCFWERRY